MRPIPLLCALLIAGVPSLAGAISLAPGDIVLASSFRLARLDAATGTATSIPTSRGVSLVTDIDIAPDHTIYVAEPVWDRITQIDPGTGAATTLSEFNQFDPLSGNGPIRSPVDVLATADGRLYASGTLQPIPFSSPATRAIAAVDPESGNYTVLASSDIYNEYGPFNLPSSMVLEDSRSILFASEVIVPVPSGTDLTSAILRFDLDTNTTQVVKQFDLSETLRAITLDSEGKIIASITSEGSPQASLIRIDADSGARETLAQLGFAYEPIWGRGLLALADGDVLITYEREIQRFDAETGAISTIYTSPNVTETFVDIVAVPVPEPSTLSLFGLGLLSLGTFRRSSSQRSPTRNQTSA